MAVIGQNIVKGFLESLGLTVKKIREGGLKTPDYEVYSNNKLIFYLEEKTLDYDFEGLKPDPTYNSISTHIHKAVKQFKSANPSRNVPNVLAFVNFDHSRDAHDLLISLTGYTLLDNGRTMKIYNVGRVREDSKHIDLYLWFDKETYTNRIWGQVHDEHYQVLKEVLKF